MQTTEAEGRRVCHKPAVWQKTKEEEVSQSCDYKCLLDFILFVFLHEGDIVWQSWLVLVFENIQL